MRVWTAVFTVHSGHVENISRARSVTNHAISTGPHNDEQQMYVPVLPLKNNLLSLFIG